MTKPPAEWATVRRIELGKAGEIRFECSKNGSVRYSLARADGTLTVLTSVTSVTSALFRQHGQLEGVQSLAFRLLQAGLLNSAQIEPFLTRPKVSARHSRGQAAHGWLASCLSAGSVSSEVPAEHRGLAAAALLFIQHARLTVMPEDCEVLVGHPELKIAGRADVIARSRRYGDVLVEFKTVANNLASLNTVARMTAFGQLELLRACASRSGRPPARCLLVILAQDGSFTSVDKPDVPANFASDLVAGYRAATTLYTHARAARVVKALHYNRRPLEPNEPEQ